MRKALLFPVCRGENSGAEEHCVKISGQRIRENRVQVVAHPTLPENVGNASCPCSWSGFSKLFLLDTVCVVSTVKKGCLLAFPADRWVHHQSWRFGGCERAVCVQAVLMSSSLSILSLLPSLHIHLSFLMAFRADFRLQRSSSLTWSAHLAPRVCKVQSL